MKVVLAILLVVPLYGCSSISKVDKDRYLVDCHPIVSEESCTNEAATSCPKGFKVTNSEKTYSFFRGYRKIVSVQCKP